MSVTTSQAPQKAPLRVFLVEDSALIRERLVDLIADPGEVEIIGFAETESESLVQLRTQKVDVAIVDLHLRSGSGFRVIEAVRAQHPEPPPTVVVLTNFAFPEYERACRQRGADYFFDKSTQFGAVKSLLRTLRTDSN